MKGMIVLGIFALLSGCGDNTSLNGSETLQRVSVPRRTPRPSLRVATTEVRVRATGIKRSYRSALVSRYGELNVRKWEVNPKALELAEPLLSFENINSDPVSISKPTFNFDMTTQSFVNWGLSVTIKNTGKKASSAAKVRAMIANDLTSEGITVNIPDISIPSIAPGSSVTVPTTFKIIDTSKSIFPKLKQMPQFAFVILNELNDGKIATANIGYDWSLQSGSNSNTSSYMLNFNYSGHPEFSYAAGTISACFVAGNMGGTASPAGLKVVLNGSTTVLKIQHTYTLPAIAAHSQVINTCPTMTFSGIGATNVGETRLSDLPKVLATFFGAVNNGSSINYYPTYVSSLE